MSSLRVPVSREDHLQGDPDARCVLVEYGDYECPYCRAASLVVTRLRRHFGEDLLFVFRNFPLTNIHPFAEPAAEAAEFAGHRGKYWEMHDGLYRHQDRLGWALLTDLAEELGLSPEELTQSVEQGTWREKIQADFNGGVRSGVNGTPTFFLNGARYDGPAEYDDLVKAITHALA